MSSSSKNIILRAVALSLLFGIIFWFADSIYQLQYFKEDMQFIFTQGPTSFIDSLLDMKSLPRSSKFYRISIMIISVAAGLITGILLRNTQKHASALQESEKNYRQAINAVNDGIFSFSMPDNLAKLSPVCYTMLGYEPDEFPVSFEIFSNLLHPNDRSRTETIIQRYVVDGEPFSCEFRMKTKSSHWLWIQLRGHVVEWDKNGEPQLVTGVLANIDHRVKTRQRLKQYTERLEHAEKIAHMGHWEFDFKSGFWTWSNEIYNIIQMPTNLSLTPSRRGPLKYVHPDDIEDVENTFRDSLQGHHDFSCTHRLLLKDGSVKYVHERGRHTYDGNGEPLRSFGTIQDITETRRTEEALYDSERRYRTLFEGAGEGILVVEKDSGKICHANKTMCSLLNYTFEEMCKLNIKDIHSDKDDKNKNAWFNLDSEENIFISEVQCRRKDDSLFPAEVNASAMNIDGRKSIVGFFTDLSKRFMLENERRMLKFAVDNSAIEIFICNPDGSCYYANTAACEKLGYSREEIEKMNFWDFDHKLNKKTFDTIWKQLKKEKNLRRESEQTDKSGNSFHVEYTADYLSVGDLEYACMYIQDISERKNFESALVTAKEKAESSDRLKSLFLANMSHEIRTPMNGILGFADLLQRRGLEPEKQQEYAKIINECGNSLLQIINNILDISKIEAGEVKMVYSKFCLNKVMEKLYSFFEPLIDNTEGAITFEMRKSLRDDECFIYSDETRLRQILINLVSNALKFTREGYIVLGYFQKDNELEFYVKDSGIGIPEEKQNYIFDPFRQAEESLSKKFRGTGLGLSIAKNYVELLGGHIRVESEVNKGSCFYFTIPFEKVQHAETSVSLDKTAEFKWIDKKILIVEDDRVNFMLLEKLIEKTGAEILHAETGQEAVDMALETKGLNLILMDVRLPDFTGWEAAKKIKKEKPGIPIIAQTANAMPEDKEKSFNSGCDGYLSKPISRDIFYNMLEEFLNKKVD